MSRYTTHNLLQGSPEWLAHRRNPQLRNASDAAAMLGLSKYKTRSRLLEEAATGIYEEVSPERQALFDRGHAVEALARPFAERIIGGAGEPEELSPLVASAVVDGLLLGASFDGITLDGKFTFEHKLLNAELREALGRGEIPKAYWPQMEQGLLITGATLCLFMASDGTEANMLHVWYEPNLTLRQRLLRGWQTFEVDLQGFKPAAPAAGSGGLILLPPIPAPLMKLDGVVTVTHNLKAAREEVTAVIALLPKEPKTDNDFGLLDLGAKRLKEAEDSVKAERERAKLGLAEYAAMDADAADLQDMIRKAKIWAGNTVTAKKDEVKRAMVQAAQAALSAHCFQLGIQMPMPDFAGAMSGKSKLSNMQDAIDTLLANSKVDADALAARVNANRSDYAALAAGYEHLFPDVPALVLKSADDFRNTIAARIAAAKAKAEQDAEAARDKIRAEERAAAEEAARKAATPVTPPTPAPAPIAAPAPVPAPARKGSKAKAPPPSPSAKDLILVIADSHKVSEAVSLHWLKQHPWAQLSAD